MTEFEVKLEVPPPRAAAVARAMRAAAKAHGQVHGQGQGCTRERLRARYFDTQDGALVRLGIVVRVRQEGRHWVQTAKAPGGNLLERLEHNVPLPRPSGGTAPAVQLARHAGTPVGDRIALALGLKGGDPVPPLVLLFETDVQRLACTLGHEGSAIELALDLGRVASGEHAQPLCELELELKHGQPVHALQLARQWCAAHGLWLSLTSKSEKGQRLQRGEFSGPPVAFKAPARRRDAGAQAAAMAALGACLGQVLGNASELADGGGGPEHARQLRAGLRRLRAALVESAAQVPGIDPAWDAPLAGAYQRLGQRLAQQDPGATVRAPAFQSALLGLTGLVHGA